MSTATTNDLTIAERALLAGVPGGLLIGGWRAAASGATLAVSDPATGLELRRIADATAQDAQDALAAAHAAGPAWAARTARERSEILRRAYELIVERTEELALLITLEMGKTLAEARGEVAYGAAFVRWYAEEAVRLPGRFGLSPDGGSRIATSCEPVGPCLLVTPWNFPLAMATRKLAPALAAGCTAVLKPATLTPLTSLLLGQILLDAGVPEGVVSIITTTDARGVFEPLLGDPRARKLSFTGSTPVGVALLQRSASQLLRVSMELGGNAPLIVFDDADLGTAVAGAVRAKLRNNGQSCTAANRIFVQDGIADRFVERFTEALAASCVGRGTEPDVDVGPLIDARAVHATHELVQDATARGAQLLAGGRPGEGAGCFYPPTVLDRVPPGARLLSEEVFAPVAPIVRFGDEASALAQANDTPHGLAAFLFTDDLDRAFRVGAALEAGMVGVNQGIVSNAAAPFGGIKHSGLGREGGPEGILEYVNVKYLALAERG